MQAAVFAAPGVLQLQDMAPRRAHDVDEIELLVEACGICGSDLQVLDVPPGHPATPGVVLGHEFVGRVVSVAPAVRGLEVGDRVVVESVVPCLSCIECRSGRRAHCRDLSSFGISRDGGLAEQVFVPARSCHPISPLLDARVAALAEPLTCVLSAYLTAPAALGCAVAVLGGGPAGQLFAELYRQGGADVLLVEPSPGRRQTAREVGPVVAVHPEELNDGHSGAFDVVVDCVGSQLTVATRLARSGGTVLLYGMNEASSRPFQQYDVTRRGLTIKGVHAGMQSMPEAVRILERIGTRLDGMVTSIPLDALPDAIGRLRAGLETKVVVCMT